MSEKTLEAQVEELAKKTEDLAVKHATEKSAAAAKAVKEELNKTFADLKEQVKAVSDRNEELDEAIKKAQRQGDSDLKNKDFVGVILEKCTTDFIPKYRDEGISKFFLEDITAKAVGTMTVSNNYTGEVIPADTKTIVPLVDRRNHLRSLISQGTTSSDVVRLPKETGGEGAVDVTTEGSEKNQVDFDVATTDYPVRKITGFVRMSEEILDDTPGFQSFVQNRMVNKLRNKEDQQLYAGTGSSGQITGLSVNAADFATPTVSDSNATIIDLVIQGAAQLETAEYVPNIMVLNPNEYANMVRSKDTQGAYIKDMYWDNSTGTINIYGIQVFKNTVMPDDFFLMGDFTLGAQIFDRMGLRVEFSSEDGDNFTKNLITMRIEERLALGIYYDAAFMHGRISTALNKLKGNS